MPARKKPTKQKPTTKTADLSSLDRAAAEALRQVDESVGSQRAALEALAALEAACARDNPHSILAREVRRLLAERKSAMRAFHVDRAERALARATLAGTAAHHEATRALEDAIDLVNFVDGDSATVRTLQGKLDDVKKGLPGAPRPFFARYLEHQKR